MLWQHRDSRSCERSCVTYSEGGHSWPSRKVRWKSLLLGKTVNLRKTNFQGSGQRLHLLYPTGVIRVWWERRGKKKWKNIIKNKSDWSYLLLSNKIWHEIVQHSLLSVWGRAVRMWSDWFSGSILYQCMIYLYCFR